VQGGTGSTACSRHTTRAAALAWMYPCLQAPPSPPTHTSHTHARTQLQISATLSPAGQMEGDIMLQNLASVVAAHVLCPTPGSRVLDMCAAPGGKTTMMAQLMGDTGEIVAFDRSHAKVGAWQGWAVGLDVLCVCLPQCRHSHARWSAGLSESSQHQAAACSHSFGL
jgi:16S rRNA C967 or C1407 C5-methylase (RsmB/RsmF family)